MRKAFFIIPGLFCALFSLKAGTVDSLKQLISEYHGRDSQLCALYNELSYEYLKSDLNQSLFYSQKAYEEARLTRNPFLIMRSLGQMGNAYMSQKQSLPAIECYIKVAKYADKIKDSVRLSAVYHNIAILYMNIGKLDLSEKYMQKSINNAPAGNSNHEKASTLELLGNIQFRTGKLKVALETFEKARTLFEKSEEPNLVAHSHFNMGTIKVAMERYTEAIRHFIIAYDKYTLMKDKPRQASSIFSIAQAYLYSGQTNKAVSYHEKAMRYYENIKKENNFAIKPYLNEMATMYQRMGQPDKAAELLHLAIDRYVAELNNIDSLVSLKSEEAFADMAIKYDTEILERDNQILKLAREKEREAKLKYRMYMWMGGAGALFMAGIGFLFWRSNQITKRANRKIEAQKKQIELQRDEIQEKNHEITSSIEYAKSLQAAILPFEHTIEKSLQKHFVLWLPRDIVSGDFYWYYEKDGIIYYAAADCTGHGVPGAFVSITCHNILNHVIIEKGFSQPGEILTQVNHEVADLFKVNADGRRAYDGMDVVIIAYNPLTRQVRFSGAMNPLVIVRKQESIEYKTDKFPIGGLTPVDHVYITREAQLEPGDWMYMFSDGYKDQFGGEKGKKVMSRHFIKLLSTCSAMVPAEQKKYLIDFLTRWQGSFDRIDDILVVGIGVE